MPELPDVEGFRRVLDRHGTGRRIDCVRVSDADVLESVSPRELHEEVEGRTLASPRRHGKWLLGPLRSGSQHRQDEPTLVFHFGMTGGLFEASPEEPGHQHDRIVLCVEQKELRYRDLRKLRGIRLAADDDSLHELLHHLGPDAASISSAELRQRLQAKSSTVKRALMDQTVLAGLGNLLADEILWRARLHPSIPANELSETEQKRLYRAMRTVLRDSMEAGRVPDTSGWLTACRDVQDASCPRCETQLKESRVSGRKALWCPACQPA